MSKFWIGITALVAVAVLSVVVASRFRDGDTVKPVALGQRGDGEAEVKDVASIVEPASLLENLNLTEQDMVPVGGIKRPKRDVDFESTEPVAVPSTKSVRTYSGEAPRVPMDSTASTRELFQELSGGLEVPPAARSSLFLPAKFDAAEFREDPQAWITRVRPGRVFQPAQPSPETAPISTESPAFQSVLQGESVVLRVKVSPGAPVSVYTPQTGEFAGTRLTSETRLADKEGSAQFTYKATAGAAGIIDIVAASPVNSEQLHFRVNVEIPSVAAGVE